MEDGQWDWAGELCWGHPSSWKPGQASLEDGLTSGDIGGNISLVLRSRAGGVEGAAARVPPPAADRGDTGLDFFSDKIISYQLIQSCDDTTLNNVRKSSSILLKLIKIKKADEKALIPNYKHETTAISKSSIKRCPNL